MNTQYKIHISLIILTTFFLLGGNTSAQVTIGAAIPPENFSILQLECDKAAAMNLPKVTEEDKNSAEWKTILAASNVSSGLVIFNTTKNWIEYWDGSKWIALSGDISVDNGLYNDNATIKLGGKLKKTTDIIQKGYNFGLQTSSGGTFAVQTIDNASTPISINNTNVSMQPKESFVVNGTALEIKKDIINITTDKFEAKMDQGGGVSTSKITLDTDNVRFDNLFYQSDVDLNNPLDSEHSGYLLTTDNQGNASWAALKPLGAIVTGKINDNNIAISEGGVNITEKSIVLPAGQWLVFGLFNTETIVAKNDVVMYNWVSLARRTLNSSTILTERLGGTNPESKKEGQKAYASPSFSHYLNVTQPTEIWVVSHSSNSNSNITINGPKYDFLGPSYFFAVRLDVVIAQTP